MVEISGRHVTCGEFVRRTLFFVFAASASYMTQMHTEKRVLERS